MEVKVRVKIGKLINNYTLSQNLGNKILLNFIIEALETMSKNLKMWLTKLVYWTRQIKVPTKNP